jgi:RimJ/RimL family protein N-acetyltransferase
MADFVPEDFAPPIGLVSEEFVLEPLGPEHNERDYAAWTSNIEHIRSTPGLEDWSWPHEMPPEENLADLEMHARHFASREGFTYSVLDPGTHDVIGCVYIYPANDGEHDARVRSWVRASRAELDGTLRSVVLDWITSDAWPFSNVLYAPPR